MLLLIILLPLCAVPSFSRPRLPKAKYLNNKSVNFLSFCVCCRLCSLSVAIAGCGRLGTSKYSTMQNKETTASFLSHTQPWTIRPLPEKMSSPQRIASDKKTIIVRSGENSYVFENGKWKTFVKFAAWNCHALALVDNSIFGFEKTHIYTLKMMGEGIHKWGILCGKGKNDYLHPRFIVKDGYI